MKIGILEPSDFSLAAIDSLSKLGTVQNYDGGNLGKFLSDKEVLFVRLAYHLDSAFLSKARKLIFLCTPTTGLNHIDVEYCHRNAIEIISLKGERRFLSTIRATPEHTLGLLLALKRNYHTAFLSKSNATWDREPHKGFEIYGSRVGILGFGRVGSIMAGYLNAMGAQVGFVDINQKIKSKEARRFKSKEEMIAWSDTILLTASYHADQGVILDRRDIDLLEGKYLVNTARAELTNEAHLIKRAKQGFFKGLAIDVLTEEQSSRKHLDDLLMAGEKHNVIVTPHIAGATYTSMARTEEFIVKKLLKLIGN